MNAAFARPRPPPPRELFARFVAFLVAVFFFAVFFALRALPALFARFALFFAISPP
jgi:uncharacterized membrane protein